MRTWAFSVLTTYVKDGLVMMGHHAVICRGETETIAMRNAAMMVDMEIGMVNTTHRSYSWVDITDLVGGKSEGGSGFSIGITNGE